MSNKTSFPMFANTIVFLPGPILEVETNHGTVALDFSDKQSYFISYQGSGLGVIDISADEPFVNPIYVAARIQAPGVDTTPGAFQLHFNFSAERAHMGGVGVIHIEDIGIDGGANKAAPGGSASDWGSISYEMGLQGNSYVRVSAVSGTDDGFVIESEAGTCSVSVTY